MCRFIVVLIFRYLDVSMCRYLDVLMCRYLDVLMCRYLDFSPKHYPHRLLYPLDGVKTYGVLFSL